MKTYRLEELLARYWKAETTLEEEEEIRQYFTTNELSGEEGVSGLFQFFNDERKIAFSKEIHVAPRKRIVNMRFLLSIAASFIVLFLAYVAMNPSKSAIHNYTGQIEDPEKALEITREALSFVNSKMTEGETAVMNNIKYFDKTFIFKF